MAEDAARRARMGVKATMVECVVTVSVGVRVLVEDLAI
jgi:hypothetical protein